VVHNTIPGEDRAIVQETHAGRKQAMRMRPRF
jgi:hypothetical protein